MEALVIHAAGDLRVQDVATPELAPGQLRVRSGGICGCDPAADRSQAMKVLLWFDES